MKYYFFLFILLGITACDNEQKPIGKSHEMSNPNILFLIADDWSFPHAGIYGDKIVRTPTFDKLSQEGALFINAYCASPSCSPSRASILTGRYPHQLESAGNLWSVFPKKFDNYVDILSRNGYFAGKTRKGWAPGDSRKGGYNQNPAGNDYSSFKDFYEQRPDKTPFCFWFGSTDPHRIYTWNSGLNTGMSLEDVDVPGFMPDLPCVRNDILDYYYEVERFDRECGQIIELLRENGELDNTIVVMTSDNGMPFPRAKANLYDYGTRMPLAIRWPSKIEPQTKVNDFVSFIDFAPSFLVACGLDIPEGMSGRKIWDLFDETKSNIDRSQVYLERERHANVRKGDLSYPMRAVRDHEFLYIRNLIPERWPAGDPEVHQSVGQWGDIDNSISKFLIMDMEKQSDDSMPDYFNLCFGKRLAEELYNVNEDPYQIRNLSTDNNYSRTLIEMREKLQKWMEDSGDIRAYDPTSNYWDTVLYTPDYQFSNFDLNQRIGEYIISSPAIGNIDCK